MTDRLALLRQRLDAYVKAEMAILDGAQEYSVGSRRLRRADLPEIRAAIKELEREIALAGPNRRIRQVGIVPLDR